MELIEKEDTEISGNEFKELEDEREERVRPRVELPELATFEDANLHPTLAAEIARIGWQTPTPVQQKCLPYTLKGHDVAGFAQTGTGKTGVFLITIADRILKMADRTNRSGNQGAPLAIILAPTRELAMQINADAENLLKAVGVSSMAVFGGVDYDKQARQIKDGVDVIVATPGRLKDYYQKKVLTLAGCQQFVCDEADRMFDMGFIEDVEFFLDKLNEKIQKLLFSATTNEQVKELAFEYLESPEYISVNPEVITPETIDQHAIIVEAKHKLKVMLGLMRDHSPKCAIIFTNTKLVAEWLHYKLVNNGIDADLITGDLPQRKRIALIHRIKEGKLKALIATDVASRGLHIADLSHVYNFDLPDDPSNYVHRIGRTARAGARGCAYSLVCEDYGQNLEGIKTLLGENMSLDSHWFDNSYLSIEDKAGNPYKDPNFRRNTLARDDRPQRGGKFDDRKKRPEGGQKPRPEGRGQNFRQERDRKPKQGDQRQRVSMHGKRYDRNSGQSQHRSDNRAPRTPLPVASAKTPATLGGMIKRFFSVMFGKKS